MTFRLARPGPFRHRSATLAVVVLTGALVAELTGSVPASAAPVAVTPSGPTIAAPTDYFATEWNDPVDFSNPEDMQLNKLQIIDGTAAMNDGRLQVVGAGQIFFARHDAGALPTSAVRDPRSRVLDAGLYTRVSFRMYSDRATVGAIGFRSCDGCADGFRYYKIVPGWHTYDLDMVGASDIEPPPDGAPRFAGSPWGGAIGLLYMAVAFNTPVKPTVTFDDFRVTTASSAINVTLGAGSGQVELWQDFNNNSGDDGDANSPGETANRVGVFNAGSTVGIPVGMFRPDVPTRFYTVSNGVRSAESSAVNQPSNTNPSPVVMTPSETGGGDYATEVRHDPWDMDQPADVFRTYNIAAAVHDGTFFGSSAGVKNDPVVVMNTGAVQVDATLYHKAAVTVSYAGGFGLDDNPGGGMNARLVWLGFDAGHQQVSDDIVVKPGRATYVVDLRTNPPAGVVDPASGSEPIGWGTSWTTFVSLLRFDPHEDRGDRNFVIEDFKLLRDEQVAPTFDIQYRDDTWAPGTTADIYVDNNRETYDGIGTLVGTTNVGPGVNTYTWDGHGVGVGAYFVHVVMHRGGRNTTASSTGQVSQGMNGAGAPPGARGDLTMAAGSPGSGPTEAQLIAFYTYILQTKFFCAVARSRNIVAAGGAAICNQLLGAWVRPKAKKKR